MDPVKYTLGIWAKGKPYFARALEYRQPFGWYERDYCSISLVSGGRGILTRRPRLGNSGTTRWELSPGDLIFLRPTDTTRWEPAREEGLAVTVVAFPAAVWHSFARLGGVGLAWELIPEPPVIATGTESARLSIAFELAVDRYGRTPGPFDLIEFWAVVVPVFAEQLRLGVTATRGSPPAWLADAVDEMYVEENLRAGLSRLVDLTHVSPGHLAKLTRRHYSLTPIGLVTELRLQYAADLLRTSVSPVSAIAERCGFGNAEYFSTLFRRAFGVSPRGFRSADRIA